MQLRNATSQAYVRTHRLNRSMAPLLRPSLCSREDNWIEVFEVIFKDLAVPAVSVKLALGSWFVLAVAMFY